MEAALRERSLPFEVEFTECVGHAKALAGSMAENLNLDTVVAVGGDGTLSEVAGGIVDSGSSTPLGYIPAGSGNDFARALHLPSNPLEALDRVLKRKLRQIDVGKAGGCPFVNSFGAGFDGEVARAANQSKAKSWMNHLGLGRLSYALTVATTLGKYEPLDITLKLDDGDCMQFHRVWMVVAANSPYYGGGMQISPGAVNDDGIFQICVVHGLNRMELLRYFPRIYNGSHIELPYVALLEGKKLTVSAPKRMLCQLDGEPAEINPAEVTIVHKGLTVIV